MFFQNSSYHNLDLPKLKVPLKILRAKQAYKIIVMEILNFLPVKTGSNHEQKQRR
jgi:hypothetical protein